MRFNVIGHVTSEIGLGIMAADLVRALTALGHDVRALDLDPGLNRHRRAHELDRFVRPAAELYRDGIDLLVFPVSAVADYLALRFGTRRIAIPLWELPDINPKWIGALRLFDGIWAPSDFIADTLEKYGLTVWRAPWPHFIADVQPDRAKFDLPTDRVIFVYAFDPSSDVRRKNPQAIITAALQVNDPRLLICLQLNRSAEATPALDAWLHNLPADRVRVIDRHLSHADALQLIASCDGYISLHRSEGLGLGMLEAMLLGKPVIATDWSGNMSFMDADSALLVYADLIPVEGSIPAYKASAVGKTTFWADPSPSAAAHHLRRLTVDAELRAVMGRAGKQHADGYQAEARRMPWLQHLGLARPLDVRTVGAEARRVLVFTPTWIDPSGVEAIHPRVKAMLQRQRMSADMDWIISRENPYPVPDHRNVLHQYRLARELCLAGGYDALITVEHDNLLPDEMALDRLLEVPFPVVYAPYLLRHGMLLLNTWQYCGDRNLGMSLSNYPRELAEAREAVVWRVSGAGMGCTLFRHEVLEAIEFTSSDDHNACPDLGFATQALRSGFISVARFDVPVAHYSGGKFIQPFETGGVTVKYIAQETCNALAAGHHLHLDKDAAIELTDAEAAELLRLGLIGAPLDAPPIERAVIDDVEMAVAPAQKRPRKKSTEGKEQP